MLGGSLSWHGGPWGLCGGAQRTTAGAGRFSHSSDRSVSHARYRSSGTCSAARRKAIVFKARSFDKSLRVRSMTNRVADVSN